MKDSTVGDLDDLYKKAKASRSRLEPTWWLNLAYYQNEQWVAWDGRAVYRPRLRADRITLTDNRITPVVRTEVAKMTKNRPVFTISPRTADEEDANASELGEQLMRYLWTHLNLQEKTSNALLWSRICGAGFLKTFWDPTLGDGTDVVVGPDNKILRDAQGKPFDPAQVDPQGLSLSLGVDVKAKRVNQGDIRVEARSPFQVFPDPLVDTFAEVEWLVEESIKSVESVKQRYGMELQPDANPNPGLVTSLMSGGPFTGGGPIKGIKVREYWCKPCVTHPNGRRAVWVSTSGEGSKKQAGQLLLEDDKPFDPMPYVMFSSIPAPGRLWPMSIVEHLRGPQTELNKVKSQIAENRNRVGNPTILASKQSVQDPEKFLESMTLPGGTYFFDDLGSQNAVPTFLVPPPLPQYVIDEIQRIEESIQEISGQHEVTSANVPPGVTAASAINLLQEADDTRLGPAMTDYEYQLGKAGQKILKLAAHYYTDQRTIRIAGDNGVWQIFDFRGSMLRDNTHVQVQAGSAFPQSKAAKQAAMQDLLTFFVQSGNPPHGRQLAQFLKDWEVGGAERLIEDYTRDDSQIARENLRMYKGTLVPINEQDNDEAHVDGHQDEMKSQRYEQQPDPVKVLFEQHVVAHKNRLASQQQAQMSLEMQVQGGGQNGNAPQAPPQGVSPGLQDAIAQAQASHQIGSQGAQQGQQMSLSAEQQLQQQRHAEESHQQKMSHAQQLHEQRLRQGAQNARQ